MKIAVINFSGNVGKSTIARHLLAPRLGNATVIAVETINADDNDGMQMRGNEFGALQENLLSLDAAVVDIGASNVEELVSRMKSYQGSHEDFDMFVVPTVPESKQERDTISTIEALADDVGVDRERIRVVLNMVDPRNPPARTFPMLFKFHAAHRGFVLREEAAIFENELFGKLANSQRTIADILDDMTDYKAMIRDAESPEEKTELARKVSMRRLAVGVNAQLDGVFAALMR
ncbi:MULTISPECIES: StbB family protein [Ralstonia solanacearum species complex]|uniref:StbB family protein n=1 Tax=Ralstonia solanacearum species complex TaxID=3116862 RepID=UPI0018D11C77|nr:MULTISPECIES: StbB family protein [Ralstonia solanacearum species complex]MDN3368320.1 StbB family protein [Ralstonia pseudosolanacearum]